MRFIICIITILTLISCGKDDEVQNDHSYLPESFKIDTISLRNEILKKKELFHYYEMVDSGYTINDFLYFDTVQPRFIYDDIVPIQLEKYVFDLDLFMFDTTEQMSTYSFLQLNEDWSYFAYETMETKHYNNIFIYEKDDLSYRCIDTLYGIVISVIPSSVLTLNKLIVLEAYWRDQRPRNIEYYEFNGLKYELVREELGKWRKVED